MKQSAKMNIIATIVLFIVIPSDVQVGAIQLCGKRLADALSQICVDYYDPIQDESISQLTRAVLSGPHERKFDVESSGRYSDHSIPFYFFSKFGHKKRNDNKGIVNECCRKSCTFSVLMSYCANAQIQSYNWLDQ